MFSFNLSSEIVVEKATTSPSTCKSPSASSRASSPPLTTKLICALLENSSLSPESNQMFPPVAYKSPLTCPQPEVVSYLLTLL